MTAPGGLDRPESGGKGTAALREQSPLDDAQRLAPRSGPDMDSHPDERKPGDDRPGSQTGTIGGGGPEAHNRSPVRATGTDEDANE